jgi:hypothetical protein
MNKLDRRGQLDVIVARVAHHAGRCQGQHRPQPLAARFDQMRGDFRDAGGMFAGHARPDHRIHGLQIAGQFRREAVMRFQATCAAAALIT